MTMLPLWVQELCHALERNDASLTKVSCVMENAAAMALAQALSHNVTVTELDLDLSFVHSSGIAALEDMLATNTTIQTLRIETCFNDYIHAPSDEHHHQQQEYSRAGIARGLVHNTSVTKLVVDGHGLDNEFWYSLCNRQLNGGVLRELHIARAPLPPAFGQYLMECRGMQRLHISNSIVYTGDESNFVQSGLLSYALQSDETIVRLSSVRVHHGVPQSQESRVLPRFINIARFQKEALYIERGFTSDCAVALADNLKTNTCLKRLYLPDMPLGAVGVAALAEMLQYNTTLQMLDIRNVFIDNEALATRALGKALCINSSLKELRLARNVAVNFSQAIAHALRVNTTLTKITLASTNVHDNGAMALASALEENGSLRVLNLDHTSVGDAGATALAQMLLQNETLKELSLKDNVIDDTGIQSLLTAFKDNYSLQALSLDAPSESLKYKLDYLNRLTPTGRAMLTRNVIPSLLPRILLQVSKDGKASSVFTLLSERPDLLVGCRVDEQT